MNSLDLLIVALLAFGVLAGWRAGFLGPMLALAGGVCGFALTVLLATLLRSWLAGIEQPGRALVTMLGLGMMVLGGEAVGGAAGALLSRQLHGTWLKPIDAVGGVVVGLAHVVLFVWLLGGLLAAGISPGLAPLARESVILEALGERLPSPGAVAGRIMSLLSSTDLPTLFAGLEPPPAAPVDLPNDARARNLAESAISAAAKVSGTGCGQLLQVGSAFFVNADHAVTNAHVVAGTTQTSLTLGDEVYSAVVVLFDPQHDLAVIYAPHASAISPLRFGAEPSRGDAAVVLGFPGGGPLTVSPAAVTATFEITGPDIYGEGSVDHEVVEMRADVRGGNSGGPLVTARGVVGGVVFGESRTAEDVAYAIAPQVAADATAPGLRATAGVDTGSCR